MAAPFTVLSTFSHHPYLLPRALTFSSVPPSSSSRRSSLSLASLSGGPLNAGISFYGNRNRRAFSSSSTPDSAVRRCWGAKSMLQSHSPLVSPEDHLGTWSALLTLAAFGLWSGNTKVGSMVSAALVSILAGLAASNLGILPFEVPAYSIVFEFLLPLAVPLLLLRGNLRQLVRSTGKLLLAFSLGAVATMIGTIVAFLLVPMRSLGLDNWKIASALMGSYIGGAVNYISIAEYLGISSSVMAAGVAADNVICAIYFMALFALASLESSPNTPKSSEAVSGEECPGMKSPTVLQTATALAVAFAICKCATYLSQLLGMRGGILPGVSTIAVILATAFPSVFADLAPSGEAISLVMMQIFFAVIGASGNIRSVIVTAPSIFLFAFVQVTVHLLVILGLGKLFRLELRLLLLASNANIGGPTTACGMATARGWETLVVPAVLVGILGITIATFLGIGFGASVLKHLC